MNFRFRAVEKYLTAFYRLSATQKESARKAWQIFKNDPFDPRLRTHKIQSLSARYGMSARQGGGRDKQGGWAGWWRAIPLLECEFLFPI